MTIAYIHQYFKTPEEPGGTRSYWIAKKMIAKGHNVTMITSKNNLKCDRQEVIDEIEVNYLKNNYDQSFGTVRKLWAFIAFMYKSISTLWRKRKSIDLVYATSTPLSVGIVALFSYYVLRKKYVFEVRDLWPEAPIQLKPISNKLIIWLLRFLEKLIYLKSEKIITLSPGMTEGVLKTGISPLKVLTVPNMAKPDKFYPRKKNKDISFKYGINNEKIVIIYFGSIGISNGLEKVIEFWSKYNSNDFQLIIAGEGSEKKNLQTQCEKKQIKNIQFLGNFKMQVISEIVNCCDISLVSFKDLPILDTNSPNKLFDSLSAGKPLIVNSRGWTKELIERNKNGFYYSFRDYDSFEKMMNRIRVQKDSLEKMGEISRGLSEKQFDKEILTEKVVEFITM